MGARWSVDGAVGGSRRVVVEGELDLVAEQPLVDEVDALLTGSGDDIHPDLLIDLGGVEFIDSSGVRALVRMHRTHGERVRFERVSAPVRKVLDIAGLTRHLGIADSSAASEP